MGRFRILFQVIFLKGARFPGTLLSKNIFRINVRVFMFPLVISELFSFRKPPFPYVFLHNQLFQNPQKILCDTLLSLVRHYSGAFSIYGIKITPGLLTGLYYIWIVFCFAMSDRKIDFILFVYYLYHFSVLHNFRKTLWKRGMHTHFWVITK